MVKKSKIDVCCKENWVFKAQNESALRAIQYSLWSRRASATENAGVKDRLFQQHDRWNPESAKGYYMGGNLQQVNLK